MLLRSSLRLRIENLRDRTAIANVALFRYFRTNVSRKSNTHVRTLDTTPAVCAPLATLASNRPLQVINHILHHVLYSRETPVYYPSTESSPRKSSLATMYILPHYERALTVIPFAIACRKIFVLISIAHVRNTTQNHSFRPPLPTEHGPANEFTELDPRLVSSNVFVFRICCRVGKG